MLSNSEKKKTSGLPSLTSSKTQPNAAGAALYRSPLHWLEKRRFLARQRTRPIYGPNFLRKYRIAEKTDGGKSPSNLRAANEMVVKKTVRRVRPKKDLSWGGCHRLLKAGTKGLFKPESEGRDLGGPGWGRF